MGPVKLTFVGTFTPLLMHLLLEVPIFTLRILFKLAIGVIKYLTKTLKSQSIANFITFRDPIKQVSVRFHNYLSVKVLSNKCS